MDTQVAEAAANEASEDGVESRRDGANKFTLGPGDSLEGRLIYAGSIQVQGRAEGELHVGGNVEVVSGATVKALIDGTNVTVRGEVEGPVSARDKLTIGKSGRLSGDINVKRLQIEDGASLNGHVRMGSFEQQGG
jgi:cytoskeletal protein CcmA (bactofilin family)